LDNVHVTTKSWHFYIAALSITTSTPHTMSTLRTFLSRRLSRPQPPLYRPSQKRWARVHDVRFSANHGVQDRIIDRYRDKLDRKAKEYAPTPAISVAIGNDGMLIEHTAPVTRTSMTCKMPTSTRLKSYGNRPLFPAQQVLSNLTIKPKYHPS